jgi:hypothetical protein
MPPQGGRKIQTKLFIPLDGKQRRCGAPYVISCSRKLPRSVCRVCLCARVYVNAPVERRNGKGEK